MKVAVAPVSLAVGETRSRLIENLLRRNVCSGWDSFGLRTVSS